MSLKAVQAQQQNRRLHLQLANNPATQSAPHTFEPGWRSTHRGTNMKNALQLV
jgi:hypothetical protein